MAEEGIKFEVRMIRPIDRSIEVKTYGVSEKIRGIPTEDMAEEIVEALNSAIPTIIRKAGGQLTIPEAVSGQKELKPIDVEEKKPRKRKK